MKHKTRYWLEVMIYLGILGIITGELAIRTLIITESLLLLGLLYAVTIIFVYLVVISFQVVIGNHNEEKAHRLLKKIFYV